MELEHILIKENPKKNNAEESSITKVDSIEPHHPNFARTRVPNVFEHQYAEYISGLKPPYSAISNSLEKSNPRRQDEDEEQKFNVD